MWRMTAGTKPPQGTALSWSITGRVVYLELGVGGNTPVIIKYPFWKMTAQNRDAVYACINLGETGAPADIRRRSICIDADIGKAIKHMLR